MIRAVMSDFSKTSGSGSGFGSDQTSLGLRVEQFASFYGEY